MSSERETKDGYAGFGFTDGHSHYMTWTVILDTDSKKALKTKIRKLKKSSEGLEKYEEGMLKKHIVYLRVMQDGETGAVFEDGHWIIRPGIFKGKLVRSMIRMLTDLYG